MNNNNSNRNNNRRRGRSNRGGQGGGNQGNRIDSRARGNAPQMLEKYKKLAHDASLNGDRVQTEYYLQFADHYFRVIADARTQRDETRPRREDREPDDFSEDGHEFEDNSSSRGRDSRDFRDADENEDVRRGNEGDEASQEDEENPFVPDNRPSRNNRSRNGRGNTANHVETRDEPSGSGLDPASLPPAIGAESEPAEEQVRPRRRTRRPRAAGDDEALEAVG
ncbi:MAG TPA: DUF4167 domain-containing protein [Croceibacterium sp.]|nr:DUF4167 domain-containing protein [Croceibacterium sp.]